MNTNYLMKKKKFNLFHKVLRIDSLNDVVSSFRICFSLPFCSDINLEATVVKTDEIRGLKQLFTPCFLLIGKNFFFKIIITTYRIKKIT